MKKSLLAVALFAVSVSLLAASGQEQRHQCRDARSAAITAARAALVVATANCSATATTDAEYSACVAAAREAEAKAEQAANEAYAACK
jgi:hypothetical protein